jgi:hypothetical protein
MNRILIQPGYLLPYPVKGCFSGKSSQKVEGKHPGTGCIKIKNKIL